MEFAIVKALLLAGGIVTIQHPRSWADSIDTASANSSSSLANITFHKGTATITADFLTPGMKFKNPLDFISLGMALVFGTAGLPHILIRFYTVPDAKTARASVVWAMVLIGIFYIMTTFFGFGAASVLGCGFLASERMAVATWRRRNSRVRWAGIFSSRSSARSFRHLILLRCARLTISASTSFAHDFFTNVIHHSKNLTR